MSKTILATVNGFTPCIDAITQDIGVIASVVFGRIWRYCQGSHGVCTASIETIAGDLGLSYVTTLKHVKILVANGYLRDETPDARNRPHTYSDTGKAGMAISIDAKSTESIDPGLQNLKTRSTESIDPGLQNLSMKKVIKKESKKEDINEPLPKFRLLANAFEASAGFPMHHPDKWLDALKEIEQMGATETDIGEAVTILRENGYQLTGPWSILTTLRNQIGKRNGKLPKRKNGSSPLDRSIAAIKAFEESLPDGP